MRYTVLKSHFNGISQSGPFHTIEEALNEIVYARGWDSLQKLHEAIQAWSKEARPGEIFRTQTSVIVVSGESRGPREESICPHCYKERNLVCDDMREQGEENSITQENHCSGCGTSIQDVFYLGSRSIIRVGEPDDLPPDVIQEIEEHKRDLEIDAQMPFEDPPQDT